MGSSREGLTAFPRDAKITAGHQLNRVQEGLSPDHFKSMPTIGPGAMEIIIDVGEQYRVFYVAKFKTAVFVLHAFEKKTQKTPQRDIDIAAKRYAEAEAIDKGARDKEDQ